MTARVRFLFDYASPWAYLASEILDEALDGVAVDYEPVYLRGLEAFRDGIPYGPNKLRYITQDLVRCLEHHGLPGQQPAQFPINGIHALRGALVAREIGCFDVYHRAVMRAAWAESRDISELGPLLELVGAAGLDAGAFASRIGAPDVKASLHRLTEQAVELGVFGVPTFVVGSEIFWGHDRLDYVRRAAQGPERGTR